MIYNYKPRGTCSYNIELDIEDDIIKSVRFDGGCAGNLVGIGALVEGMKVSDVIKKFDGIKCGHKPTSCPDQLAKALKAAQNQ